MQVLHKNKKQGAVQGFNNLLCDMKTYRTQQGLAMKLHMDQSTLSRKLSGKTKVSLEEAIQIVTEAGYPISTVCKYCPLKNR
jgi:transcriptional regulator with XRE-family HTH domain